MSTDLEAHADSPSAGPPGPSAPVPPVEARSTRRRTVAALVLGLRVLPFFLVGWSVTMNCPPRRQLGALLAVLGVVVLVLVVTEVLRARSRPARLAPSDADADVLAAATGRIDDLELSVVRPEFEVRRSSNLGLVRFGTAGVLEVRPSTYRFVLGDDDARRLGVPSVEWPRDGAHVRLVRWWVGPSSVRLGNGPAAVEIDVDEGAEARRLVESARSGLAPTIEPVVPRSTRVAAALVAAMVLVVGGFLLFNAPTDVPEGDQSGIYTPPRPSSTQVAVPDGVQMDLAGGGYEVGYGSPWAGKPCQTLRVRAVGFPREALVGVRAAVEEAKAADLPVELTTAGPRRWSADMAPGVLLTWWKTYDQAGVRYDRQFALGPDGSTAVRTVLAEKWVADQPGQVQHTRVDYQRDARGLIATAFGVTAVEGPSAFSTNYRTVSATLTPRDAEILRGAAGCS